MTTTIRYRRARDVRFRILDGEAVVIRQGAAEVLGLDPVGSRILELLEGELTIEEVVDLLAEEFDAARAELESDAAAFLAELAEAGVIEAVETRP